MTTSTASHLPLPADPAYESSARAGGSRDLTKTVSWGAILAGAAGAAALSLILLMLGSGLGLSSVSPWSGQGVSASTFGISTIIWLAFTQLAASGLGGYLAGRLRGRWYGTDTDEVYFRDTAHGFLAWAIATLATAALLTSAIGTILSGGAQLASSGVAVASTAALGASTAAAASPAGPAGTASPQGEPRRAGDTYAVDKLLRPGPASTTPATATGQPDSRAATTEIAAIFTNALRTGSLAQDDAAYLAQLVAQRTGIAQADAEKRVNDAFADIQRRAKQAADSAREAADTARKASAHATLWMFIALLMGAFVASWMATYGGRRRDLI